MFIQTRTSCKWIHDSQRFLLEFFDPISNSPSQIYHSILPLTPSSSWLHKCYAAQLSQDIKVVMGLSAEWGTCSRMVPLGVIPYSAACWKDTIAIGLNGGNIIILNAITGSQVAVLSGHNSSVGSTAFSLDGTFLASASDDKTAKLWDIQTGGVIKTYDHTSQVYSVSISPDNATLASGCQNGSIHLWSVGTGMCVRVISGHKHWVNSVSFSPTNSQYLISASEDHTVKQWGIHGSQIGSTHEGDSVAFSPDGTHFVSWRYIARIQDFESGAVVTECQVPGRKIECCCFSPSGELMAASAGSTIYVWNITGSDPHLFKILVGHHVEIHTLAFSSSLISVSRDRSVKFWQIGTPSANPVTVTTMSTPPTPASIVSVSLQARNGIALSSDLDGVVKTWDILTGLCKASFQTPARGNTYRDAQLIEDRLILVWLVEEKIYIWDNETDSCLKAVDASEVDGLRISGDGSMVFYQAGKYIQSWSMQTWETVATVELKHSGWDLDPLYADGSRIWVCFKDLNEGWDFGTPGSSPTPLPNTFPDRPHLNFIYGTLWATGGPSKIKDTVTRKDVFQLAGKYAEPRDVQWDGRYLVAGYSSGEVLILDFDQMVPQ